MISRATRAIHTALTTYTCLAFLTCSVNDHACPARPPHSSSTTWRIIFHRKNGLWNPHRCVCPARSPSSSRTSTTFWKGPATACDYDRGQDVSGPRAAKKPPKILVARVALQCNHAITHDPPIHIVFTQKWNEYVHDRQFVWSQAFRTLFRTKLSTFFCHIYTRRLIQMMGI